MRQLSHCKLQYSKGPTQIQQEHAVKYTYRPYKARRDGTPNESSDSGEIDVVKNSGIQYM